MLNGCRKSFCLSLIAIVKGNAIPYNESVGLPLIVQKNGSRVELIADVLKVFNLSDKLPERVTGFCFPIFPRSCPDVEGSKASRIITTKRNRKEKGRLNLVVRFN
jgi:hypothetical protein